jgi:hypothetical protein
MVHGLTSCVASTAIQFKVQMVQTFFNENAQIQIVIAELVEEVFPSNPFSA